MNTCPKWPAVLAILTFAAVNVSSQPMFSASERADIVAYWNEPGRYVTTAPQDAPTKGVWQSRLTVEGSRWLHRYQRALRDASEADRIAWEEWVSARSARDGLLAEAAATAANRAVQHARQPASVPETAPSLPPIPDTLVAAAGNPPPLVAAVAPLRYVVQFDDGAYEYVDHVPIRRSFVYYRFDHGTVGYGERLAQMPDRELDALFTDAGMTPSEARVAKAVSKLEGGFETINTYDTGYVSVGFIQFTTTDDGTGSLVGVLNRLYMDHPVEFGRYFRRYGIEVGRDRTLVVVDPSSGAELSGPDAVLKVIDDKRLIAVFQRAGRLCREFRIAQVAVAKSHYWPGDLEFTAQIAGNPVTGRVRDIIHSEAGLATLYDRRVNRGNIAPFADVVQATITSHNLTSLEQLTAYEREIVAALKYRVDFLNDPGLSQPE